MNYFVGELHSTTQTGHSTAFVEVESIVSRNAATVQVNYDSDFAPYEFNATGSSKRAPGDVYNYSTGGRLALADALRNLADQLEASVEVD
jgi:hypothetical protein